MAAEHAVTYNMSMASNSTIRPSSSGTDAVKGVQIAATILIFLVGVPLNGLVVWALGVHSEGRRARRGSSQENRSANNFRVYVLNLSVADLLLLLRIPLMLGYLANGYSWPFGAAFCRLTMFLRVIGLYASAFLLCAVALERCMCLLRPVWSRLQRPVWAVPLTCGLLWAVATALSAPYLHYAVLEPVPLYGNLQCYESQGNKPVQGLFVIETIAGFMLPLVVFLGSNTAILLKVRQAGAPMRQAGAPMRQAGALMSPSSSGAPVSPTSSPHATRRMVRLYQVMFLTMLLFLVFWVPYFVCRFVIALTAEKDGLRTCKYVSLYLVYIKSAVNPVLYVFAARGLGRTVRASLVSTIAKVFNEDSAESIRRKSLKASNSQSHS